MKFVKSKSFILALTTLALTFGGFQVATTDAASQPVTPKVNQQDQNTYVLIHGAWADETYWTETAAELRKMGQIVYTPEYPGHGKGQSKNVTHEEMTKSIVDFIKTKNLNHIVLLGHSFGGTIVEKTAEQVPDRIKRLVFLNAFVPADGESVVDQFPAPVQGLFQQLRSGSKNDTIMLPFPVFRETFANTADLQLAKKLYDQISPEPAGPLFQKLDLKKFYSLDIPKSYINLTEDTALPQGEYGWHPHQSSRLGIFRLIQGNGDHMTTVHTNANYIAKKIIEAGRD